MKQLICFGDSITEGMDHEFIKNIESAIGNIEVHNVGISGNNTIDGLARIEKDILCKPYDFVTVMFGSNDAAFHKKIEVSVYKNNLYQMVQQIGVNKTILITPPPVDESRQKKRSNEVLYLYAIAVKEVAEETGCEVIDFFDAVLSQKNYKDILRGPADDGLHFGKLGYEHLARLLVEKISSKWFV